MKLFKIIYNCLTFGKLGRVKTLPPGDYLVKISGVKVKKDKVEITWELSDWS